MKFLSYLKDKKYEGVIFIFSSLTTLLLLRAFKVPTSLMVAIGIIWLVTAALCILIDFLKRHFFYHELLTQLEELDKKYLVLEMMWTPSFYEGELLYQILYEINKSMSEEIKQYKISIEEFKEYIEMWIHEVKIPIASLMLMSHNNKNGNNQKMIHCMKEIDRYVEQVLFFSRSEEVQKDCLIRQFSLSKVISQVALKNKDEFLLRNIDFNVKGASVEVVSDAKWLEFMLNQLLNNSIKYYDSHKPNSYIYIEVTDFINYTVLSLYDNGIGISQSDVGRVFEKSFTGRNGRLHARATGMGLYITKKLCEKLGHELTINSVEGEYTEIKMTFFKHHFFGVMK